MVLAVTTLGTLFYSIIVFLIIIMLLVVILLFARDKLSPKGDVTLHINERDLVVSPGSNLLTTLSGSGPRHLTSGAATLEFHPIWGLLTIGGMARAKTLQLLYARIRISSTLRICEWANTESPAG